MLPTIAHLIDAGLADTSEQLEARSKPWMLDDALVALKRVNDEALEWCGVYDRQLNAGWVSASRSLSDAR